MSARKGGAAGSSVWRVVEPERRYMPTPQEQDDERSRLLSKMEALYRATCDRLNLRMMPVAFARLLDAGVCIGLLDPVSSIMANALATTDIRPKCGHSVSSDVVVARKLGEVARRSLDGLLAFLLYFFPYLPDWEAVRYLLLADADLLVATRLVVADRGMMNFSFTSAASATAFQAGLRFAADTAKHPEPQRLVDVWMSMSSHLHQVMSLLSDVQFSSQREGIYRIRYWLLGKQMGGHADAVAAPDLGKYWDLSASRSPYNTITDIPPYQHTWSITMVLLNAIRGFVLRALARLPRGELRRRYHRSLLKGGYCYGPLDPISNIIINTIWYDATFPAAKLPVLDMIGPRTLTRLEGRSFYGLVSFLKTRYHSLSEHYIVQCLIACCAHLSIADPKFDDNHAAVAAARKQWEQNISKSSMLGFSAAARKMEEQIPCTGIQEAYEAAATAAWHPHPEAHAAFLSAWKTVLNEPALSMLQSRACLTSEDVQFIANLLAPKQLPTPEQVKKSSYPTIAGKFRSEAQQARICSRVKASLDNHLLPDGEPMYKLHVICGVNEDVCGPEYCNDKEDAFSFAPCKYRYSHVNFLATQNSSRFIGKNPVLFFAEFDNEEKGAALLCCRVDVPKPFAEHVRCLYCEVEGAKIVHPTLEKYHGGEKEVEEAIREEHDSLTNDEVISLSTYNVRRLCAHDEDFIYVDVCEEATDLSTKQL
uniref:Uncharacterized protein n=1 Tax=Oryza punctata TaxID=4537 RepID=A0A0E0M525_ORYPU